MSNYATSGLAFSEFPGSYSTSNHSSMSSHRVTENANGQFSQRYYQSSSSLASALTPVVSRVEKKCHRWPQPSLDKTGLQEQWSRSLPSNKGRYAEHRMYGQTTSRATSVMPERHMYGWNSVNDLQDGYEGNHSSLDHDTGPRRAFIPAQDMYQLPKQQRQVPITKLSDSLDTRPGIPPYTSPSASKPFVSQTSSYYVEPNLERLYFEEATNDNMPSSTTPTYPASSDYSTAERLTPVAGQPSLSPEFLYVNVDNLEDEPTIHCPHKWCKSTFTRSNDLARHLATASMHREPVPIDPSKRCRLCGEEFSRSDARNRHEIKRSCGKKRTRRIAAV